MNMCAYVGGQGPNACVSAKEFRLKLCAQLGSWLIKSIAVFRARLEKRPCRLREKNLGGIRLAARPGGQEAAVTNR